FRHGPAGERQRPGGAIFAWIDAFLLPDNEQLWAIDLPRVVEEARERRNADQRPLIFVDFTGVTCTNCRYNEHNVFTKPEVGELFKQYKLVQMYTDEVPAKSYKVRPADERRVAEAAANLTFQKRLFGTEQLPLYVILEPLPDGKVQVVD